MITYLLGVLEVLEEGLLVPERLVFTRIDRYIPGDTLVHVGSGVAEALSLTGLAAEDTVQVGTNCGSISIPIQNKSHNIPLLGPPFSVVWHCAQRVLKRPAPFLASPSENGIVNEYSQGEVSQCQGPSLLASPGSPTFSAPLPIAAEQIVIHSRIPFS